MSNQPDHQVTFAQHHTDDFGRDAGGNARRHWTVGAAIDESSLWVLIAVIGGVVTAVVCGSDPAVPIATGITVAALAPAVLVDVLDRRLPNHMVATAALVGVSAAAITIASGTNLNMGSAAIGAVAMAAPLGVMFLISPASMGLGDVKMALVLGAALGLISPSSTLLALLIGSLSAAIAGLIARRRSVPFGPGLFAGAVAVLVLHANDTATMANVVAALTDFGGPR